MSSSVFYMPRIKILSGWGSIPWKRSTSMRDDATAYSDNMLLRNDKRWTMDDGTRHSDFDYRVSNCGICRRQWTLDRRRRTESTGRWDFEWRISNVDDDERGNSSALAHSQLSKCSDYRIAEPYHALEFLPYFLGRVVTLHRVIRLLAKFV